MPEHSHEFAMERRLKELAPDLHRNFRDAVFALQYNLSRYQAIFLEYTDHTNLHSMTVADFCNRLIGDQLERLNADELYVLLMGCYFHDTGMGLSQKDFELFSQRIDFGDYFDTHSREDVVAAMRDFHHEYSGMFIEKYADFFEFPSREHEWAIREVARGHRRTNLLDESKYPLAYSMPNGNTVCLPYLAALLRLADEVDVAAERNPILLYDIEALMIDKQIFENKKLLAVRSLEMTEDAFILWSETSEPVIREGLRQMAVKMQDTLDVCRKAVLGRTPYVITQKRVELKMK